MTPSSSNEGSLPNFRLTAPALPILHVPYHDGARDDGGHDVYVDGDP